MLDGLEIETGVNLEKLVEVSHFISKVIHCLFVSYALSLSFCLFLCLFHCHFRFAVYLCLALSLSLSLSSSLSLSLHLFSRDDATL